MILELAEVDKYGDYRTGILNTSRAALVNGMSVREIQGFITSILAFVDSEGLALPARDLSCGSGVF